VAAELRPGEPAPPAPRAPWSVRRLGPYAILALPGALVVAFVGIPIVQTALKSFDKLNPRGQVTGFGGLANYRALFSQPLFVTSLRNTAVYAVASVVLCVLMAYVLAQLLSSRMTGASRPLLVSIFSPTVMPMIAAANIWLYFLAPRIGLFGELLSRFGMHGSNLLGEPGTALGVLVALFVWKFAPYFALFIMAGLQAIPQSVREALRTEDPTGRYAFRRVVLPMLGPMLAFVTTMALLYSVETIDPVYVMTQGGPNNGTSLLMFYLYQLGFNYFSWGPAAALSALLMASLSTLSGLSLIGLERRAFHWQ
jgi:sn-glycerol 3-phosphate transport system permease protein